MKQIYSILFALLCIVTAHAATGLNPYAYKLEAGTQSDYNRKMTLKYWLNAPAKTVSISLTYEEDDMNKVANYTGTTREGKKVMYQGQMYILRDGKAYNMQGQMVGIKEDIIK